VVVGEAVFTVVVAAVAAVAAVDMMGRLERSQPAPSGHTDEEPAVEAFEVPPVVVGVAAAVPCLAAGIRIQGSLSLPLGLALAVVLIGVVGLVGTGRGGVAAALARAALVVAVCGFGGGHAVLLRLQPRGIRLALFLIVAVAFYETAATIFEMATVQVRPGQNRQAPVAGAVLLFLVGLVFGSVANPPITFGAGVVMGLTIAVAAATGRALPALFADERREGGMEVAAVTTALFIAAPVAYYVARVVI